MRRVPRVLPITSFVVAAILIGWVSYNTANHFLGASKNVSGKGFTCRTTHIDHLVAIQYSVITPEHTQARLCDKLIITNRDNRLRLIAFGPHDHHIPYDGITEKTLGLNQSLTITLNQIGTYNFHDHIEDPLYGSFTVTN